MATNSPSNHAIQEAKAIQMVQDNLTFDGHQEIRLKEIESKVEDELRKKKKDWEREVRRMRDEFLKLYPTDQIQDKEELIKDPLIIKRRGSADVLDRRKMKTLIQDIPDSGRKFKLRFNLVGFEPINVKVTAQANRIVVSASKMEEDENGQMIEREYTRRIEKPKRVDISKIKSFLTSDGILVVEAPMPPHSLNMRKLSRSQSPSRSSQGSQGSRSPSSSPKTPVVQKAGQPVFIEANNGMRRLSLFIEIGQSFRPKDITVSIVNDNMVRVKAKHEDRTKDSLSKYKFCRDYELSEKIDPFTLRSGLTISDGRLLIGAVGKGFRNEMSIEEAGVWLSEEMGINNKKMLQCNVVGIPTDSVMSSSMTSSISS